MVYPHYCGFKLTTGLVSDVSRIIIYEAVRVRVFMILRVLKIMRVSGIEPRVQKAERRLKDILEINDH